MMTPEDLADYDLTESDDGIALINEWAIAAAIADAADIEMENL